MSSTATVVVCEVDKWTSEATQGSRVLFDPDLPVVGAPPPGLPATIFVDGTANVRIDITAPRRMAVNIALADLGAQLEAWGVRIRLVAEPMTLGERRTCAGHRRSR